MTATRLGRWAGLGAVLLCWGLSVAAQNLGAELRDKCVKSGLALGYIGGSAMQIFPTGGGPLTREIMENHAGPCRSCPGWFSSDGNLVIWENRPFDKNPSESLVIETVSGQRVTSWLGGPLPEIRALALSPDRTRVLVEAQTNSNRLMSGGLQCLILGTGNSILLEKQPAKEDLDGSSSVGWSEDSRRVVFSRQSKIIILDIESGDRRVLADGTNPAWSPDGRMISFIGPDKSPRLADVSSNREDSIWNHQKITGPMSWSPDSSYISFSAARTPRLPLSSAAEMIVYRVRDGSWLALAQFSFLGGSSNKFGWLYHYKDFLALNESRNAQK